MKIFGHRGASYYAPDNTRASFDLLKTFGVDGFETDVQLTKDGKMVIHHNYSIDAQSDGSGLISQMTLDELRQYDFGSWKDKHYKDEKILTFDECLEIARTFDLVNIELKAPMDRNLPYIKKVYEAIKQSGIKDKLIISAFDHTLLKELREIDDDLKLGALILAPQGNTDMLLYLDGYFRDKALSEVKREDLRALNVNASLIAVLGIPGDNVKEVLYEFIRSISAIYPGLSLKEIYDQLSGQKNLVSYIKNLGFKVDYVHPDHHIVNEIMVKRMHENGVKVNVWTVDKEDDIRKMIACDVDGIISNRADFVKKIVMEK